MGQHEAWQKARRWKFLEVIIAGRRAFLIMESARKIVLVSDHEISLGDYAVEYAVHACIRAESSVLTWWQNR
jgi:hypothetical protein